MTILALETSSRAAGCALLRDGTLIGEVFLNGGLTHSQTAMPMVNHLLELAGIGADGVDAFAVSTGPGSFTGLRIGISTVKGMALATGKPCIGVSTLEGLAENVCAFSGTIIPAMDARRGQVYTALFRSEGGVLTRLREDCAVGAEALADWIREETGPVLLVGDGAALCKQALAVFERVRLAPENLLHQRAGSVARVAARRAETDGYTDAGALAPLYLRLPQAERERLARLERPAQQR